MFEVILHRRAARYFQRLDPKLQGQLRTENSFGSGPDIQYLLFGPTPSPSSLVLKWTHLLVQAALR